jgi:hypothetical protein
MFPTPASLGFHPRLCYCHHHFRQERAKPRKTHGNASARSYTGAEAAEIAADKAEKNSRVASGQPTVEVTPENSSDEDVVVPGTPAELVGESQGGTTITLAMRTPERLRPGLHLVPRASAIDISSPGSDLAWQLPASTAPPSLGQAEGRPKRKREGTIRYRQGREDGYTTSIGVSQPRE